MNAPDILHSASAVAPLEQLRFDNSFARLPPSFFTRLAPSGLSSPYMVGASEEVARMIGLDPTEFGRPEFAEVFAGNRLLPGSDSLAAVYSGHQFGVWAGQLGDGRAHLLGGVSTPGGALELQLKGAGQTPYSRFADGRAVLRSSIREFLCSEAMAALGIPTTRALCVIGSDEPVVRESIESAAVVTRVAPSFVRFGSFEHWSSRDRDLELKQLADYIIDTFRPELCGEPKPYEALLRDAAQRSAEMVAQWQAVGFMHGVMNTDNMSILGLTLDYGPFGFMEAFDAGHICNHSDHQGRYAYRAQPRIAHWNLYALGDAMVTLIGHPDISKAIIDEHFVAAYNAAFMALMRGKLGLRLPDARDEDLIVRALGLLQSSRADYTLFWRALSRLPMQPEEAQRKQIDAPVLDLIIDREAASAWLADWRTRLAQEALPDTERQAAMLAVNPKYILRNWIAESAIRRARERDFGGVAEVLQCLRRPYDEQPEFERYAAPPPDWAQGLSVSCSS